MSDEIEDLSAIEEIMLGMTKTIMDEARSGKINQSIETLIAVLHHPKRSPKIILIAVENGDGVGQDEIQDFCADAQEYLEPGETISIESHSGVELMAAIHALSADTEGGEE